jgi:hypothetical protein
MVIAPTGQPEAEGKLEDEEVQKADPGLASARRARDDESTAIIDGATVRRVLYAVGDGRATPTVAVDIGRGVPRGCREQRPLSVGATTDPR